MKKKHQYPGIISLILVMVFLVTRMWTPQPALAMSIGEERELGEKLLYTARKNFKLLDDPDITQYINNLGAQVLAVAGPQFFNYRFFIVRNKEFNAFAAPSGLIFFFTGLVRTMDNEDELVSVMAHEIGHVRSRHIAGQMEKEKTIGAFSLALAAASLALGNPALSQGLLTGTLAAGQTMSLSYSRHDEEEADRLAFDSMRAMGRNPQAMLDMLKIMRRITRYRMDQIPPYLLTHPNPEMRLDYVQSLLDIEKSGKDARNYRKTDNFTFLRMKYRIMVNVSDSQQLQDYFKKDLEQDVSPEKKAMAHYGLALVAANEFDHRGALSHMDEVLSQYPDKPILKVDKSVILMEDGRLDEALALLQQANEQEPDDMFTTFQLARVLVKLGRSAEARELFLRVKTAMPEYSRLYYELGSLESGTGNQALSQYYLGKHYMLEGKFQLAKQNFEKASRSDKISQAVKRDIEDQLRNVEKYRDL